MDDQRDYIAIYSVRSSAHLPDGRLYFAARRLLNYIVQAPSENRETEFALSIFPFPVSRVINLVYLVRLRIRVELHEIGLQETRVTLLIFIRSRFSSLRSVLLHDLRVERPL